MNSSPSNTPKPIDVGVQKQSTNTIQSTLYPEKSLVLHVTIGKSAHDDSQCTVADKK